MIPFVGAGISTPGLRDWNELLQRLWVDTGGTAAQFGALGVDNTVIGEMLRARSAVPLADLVGPHLFRGPAEPNARHERIARGPWPMIVTTNWDDLLERGAAKSEALLVRYRQDAQRVHAELRADVRPAVLWKIHGDLGAGRDEFVMGHRDYRRLVARDLDSRALLGLLVAEYSLLFFGHSLKDPDVLGVLDEAHETLGHAIGPHFWLTVKDECPDALRDFLHANHGIRAIVCANWGEAERLLTKIDHEGRAPSVGLCEWRGEVGRMRVSLVDEGLPLGTTDAVVASAGVTRGGRAYAGGQTIKALGLDGVAPDVSGAPGTAVRLPGPNANTWFVFGQAPGEFGRTGLVSRGMTELLTAVTAAGFRRVHVPLLAGGGAGLDGRESLCAMLHAAGGFSCEKHALDVIVHLPKDQGSRLLADVTDGRLLPARVLARGRAGAVEVTAIHPVGRQWHVARVRVPSDATIGDLVADVPGLATSPAYDVLRPQRLAVARRFDATTPLVVADVTDGCLVYLLPAA